jgi:hypothetical protein
VPQARQNAKFPQKALLTLWISQVLGPNNLERNRAIQGRIVGAKDDAHGSAGQLPA